MRVRQWTFSGLARKCGRESLLPARGHAPSPQTPTQIVSTRCINHVKSGSQAIQASMITDLYLFCNTYSLSNSFRTIKSIGSRVSIVD
jgi:hypothetical protein